MMSSPRAWVLPLLLLGCNGGSSSPDAPRDLGPGIEGLQFPDIPARFDQARDLPQSVEKAVADRARERTEDGASPDLLKDSAPDLPLSPDTQPGPDLGTPDVWKGGPCFYDWASWTCQTSGSTCTAGCGIATLSCTSSWITICFCNVNGVAKQCGSASGSGCNRCQNAFKSGCCVPP